ncbi:hypothetical protein [Corynebacterium nasicanis]|uniref:Cardiolipin synthase N-terminal domain-containing protein n=1 Tax=Corynebacterium nasicanis TaxID=1448267 RepID=A0ABW1Q9F3_9CORY
MNNLNPSLSQLRTEFSDLSTPARAGVVAAVLVELAAKVGAWVDLSRRPAAAVRGPKWAWALAQLINGLGPAAYWAYGRK